MLDFSFRQWITTAWTNPQFVLPQANNLKINGNGLSQNGFTIEELEKIQETLRENKIEFEYYRLDSVLENKEGVEPAGLLMIPNGIKQLTGERTT